MIEIFETILPYIKGLWTLPWILIGLIVTLFLSRAFGEEKTNRLMKKIGLILLYIFVPLLLFKILLGVDFKQDEISFSITCFVILILMYILAYWYAKYKLKKLDLKEGSKSKYIKTVLTNQGRSSAFVGGAMLAIDEWRVFATLYMIIGAIFLFAIIPYILSYLHKRDIKKASTSSKIHALPWYLRIFPWYLLCFAFAAIILHGVTGFTSENLGEPGIVFDFMTSLTIPAALYYVGAGIHIRDIKEIINIVKRRETNKDSKQNWVWTKDIFYLTVVVTSVLTFFALGLLFYLNIVSKEWFAVITINSILPITSTNMFLVPYGIDKKSTAHSITWTTIACVPIVVVLIFVFKLYLI